MFLDESESDDPFAEEAPPERAQPAAPPAPAQVRPRPRAQPRPQPEPEPEVEPIPPPERTLPDPLDTFTADDAEEGEGEDSGAAQELRVERRTRLAASLGFALLRDGSTFAVPPGAGDAADWSFTLGAEVGHALGRVLSLHAGAMVGFQLGTADGGTGTFTHGGGPTSATRLDASDRASRRLDAHAVLRVHGGAFFLGVGARGGMLVHRYQDARRLETPRGYGVLPTANDPPGTERLLAPLAQGILQVGLLRRGIEGRLELGYGLPGLSVGFSLAVPLWRSR